MSDKPAKLKPTIDECQDCGMNWVVCKLKTGRALHRLQLEPGATGSRPDGCELLCDWCLRRRKRGSQQPYPKRVVDPRSRIGQVEIKLPEEIIMELSDFACRHGLAFEEAIGIASEVLLADERRVTANDA